MQCSPQRIDLSTGLQQQFNEYHRFADFNHCAYLTLGRQLGERKPFRIVDSCPDIADNGTSVQCTATGTLSSYVPVESQGVLFASIFCTACHGVPFHWLQPLAYHGFACKTRDLNKVYKYLLPLVRNIDCSEYIVKIKPPFNNLRRYADVCTCSEYFPYRRCEEELYQKECHAYSNVVLDNVSGRPCHNEACRQRDDNDSIMSNNPPWCGHHS